MTRPFQELTHLSWAGVESPFGTFGVGGRRDAVTAVLLPNEVTTSLPHQTDCGVVSEAAAQLADYLAGKRKEFSVPLSASGPPFQLSVWETLDHLKYGEILTYGALAAELGRPRATRAVGTALGRNPLPILRPCHRVLAAHGLGGYAGGLELKRQLLRLEGIQF